jgi:GNAT superfamily N-acetyltransferase
MPHQFDPRRYAIDVSVDPPEQRRGIGSALFDHLMAELRRRDAAIVRSEAKESLPGSLAFLARRGFVEVQRFWESRLDLAGFDPAPFAGAEARAAAAGVAFTTLAAEYARDGERAIRAAYELDLEVSRDIPLTTPMTDASSYEQFSRSIFQSPNILFDAWSIAKHGDRFAGVSNLFRSLELPDVLYQGLTGVRREYRRQGIALALKMRGLRYAVEHGYREIRTWNNVRNRPMLSINEAMGFVKQPAWIELEKTPV